MIKLKIAYFGYDFFWGCLDVLQKNGHEIVKLFTFETDNIYNFNTKVIEIASKTSIPIQLDKVTHDNIIELIDTGCELIVSAAYPYKIPVSKHIKGINIHPTLLPEGRGPWPLPYIILNDLTASGVTIHRLEEEFDMGNILIQDKFEVTNTDDLESISCKSQLIANQILSKLIGDFDKYWNNSTQQGQGSYWPFPSEEKQTINWNDSIKNIDKTARAYGKLESIAKFEDKTWVVKDLTAWEEKHAYQIGSVVHKTNKEIVIAASDGLVCLRHYAEDIN